MFMNAIGHYNFARMQRISIRSSYCIACFIASVMVFSMFLQVKINGFSAVMFGEMIYGKAHKPWAYRALLPFCVRITTSAIPEDLRNSLNQKMWENNRFIRFNKRWQWEKSLITEYIIASIFMYLALGGFFFSLRYLFGSVYEAPTKLLDFTSLFALLALPVMFRYYSYIYDFPNLFFFTLCLALMIRNEWLLFLLVYTLSCFNKETTILLTMLFAIYFWCCSLPPLKNPLLRKLILIQIGIYFTARLMLFYFFHSNPGMFVGINLLKHNLSMFPYPIGTAVGFLLIIMAILYKWEEKPLFLKCGLWMLLPLVLLCLLFGWLDEMRDYYEVYPVVILLMAHTIGDILQWKAVPRVIPSP